MVKRNQNPNLKHQDPRLLEFCVLCLVPIVIGMAYKIKEK